MFTETNNFWFNYFVQIPLTYNSDKNIFTMEISIFIVLCINCTHEIIMYAMCRALLSVPLTHLQRLLKYLNGNQLFEGNAHKLLLV